MIEPSPIEGSTEVSAELTTPADRPEPVFIRGEKWEAMAEVLGRLDRLETAVASIIERLEESP